MSKTYHTHTMQFKVDVVDWHINHGENESKVVRYMVLAGGRLQGDKLALAPCERPSPSPEPKFRASPTGMCWDFTAMHFLTSYE